MTTTKNVVIAFLAVFCCILLATNWQHHITLNATSPRSLGAGASASASASAIVSASASSKHSESESDSESDCDLNSDSKYWHFY